MKNVSTVVSDLCSSGYRYLKRKDARALIRKADFPSEKSLETFEFGKVPSLKREKVFDLSQNGYIDRKEVIALIGGSGLGKTHLSIALGIEACRLGYTVKYYSLSDLINKLLEAEKNQNLRKVMKKLDRYELLVLDHLGYAPLSEKAASLLFDIVNCRYERGSVIISSNLSFAYWTEFIKNPELTEALLDRLVHHCHLLELRGRSYRTRQLREKVKKDGKRSKG